MESWGRLNLPMHLVWQAGFIPKGCVWQNPHKEHYSKLKPERFDIKILYYRVLLFKPFRFIMNLLREFTSHLPFHFPIFYRFRLLPVRWENILHAAA